MRARLLELLRFGAVGGVAFLVDVGLFNLLRFGPGHVLDDKVLTAKVVSVTVATLVSWLGNRYWAFAAKRSDQRVRELVVFLVVNVVGMGIAVGCLAVSHYLLGFDSAFADNVSGNIVGIGLGTLFRYVAYRGVVFTAEPGRAAEASAPSPAPAATPAQ